MKRILVATSSDLVYSEAVSELIDKKDYDEVQDVADATCTTDDTEGTNGIDIFTIGFNFGLAAVGKNVLYGENEGISFFFIGTEQEVMAKISALSNKDSEDESEADSD